MRTLMRRTTGALLFLGLLGTSAEAIAQPGGPDEMHHAIAVVVHPASPLSDLSSEELRRLFLGSTTSLEGGERVELGGLNEARSRFYRSALGMSEDRLKRHWISRVFAGQPGTPPVEFRSTDELLEFVASHPGAVAFVHAGSVDGKVKVVSIDGRTPGDVDYAMH